MAEQHSTSSRFVGRLREVSRGQTTPLGFGRVQAQRVPAMLLVARLGRNDAALAEAAVAAGADVVVAQLYAEGPGGVRFGSLAQEGPSLEGVVKAVGDRPVGVAVGTVGAVTAEELNHLAKLGIDFVAIHPQRSPATLLEIEALGHVVRLDRESPSGPVRAVNETGVDAAEIAPDRPDDTLAQLTIYDLASLRHLIDSIRRPVLVPSTWAIQPGDLKHLRELGVEALVLTPEVLGESAGSVRTSVAEYRQAIDKLGPPIGRGRALEGRRVVLPRVTVSAHGEEEEEEEDDD